MTTDLNIICPCGQNINNKTALYTHCCAPYHQASAIPVTPEQLMRSRYSAFVTQEYDYLIQTHHPDFLNGLTVNLLAESEEPHWLSLQIISTHTQGISGQVCFQAWYRDTSGLDAINECSQFVCEDGKWFYTQGKQKAAVYPKRNEVCLCNSGKKYKQCCLV
ncbi:SEC-C domain-containing protein [Shewanella sp. D64]|uniref:YchJ family protein n=1 Tax=unclassified Shewanella TaxID=196818 RepID=UPI0022BA5516|nr:MULTISPECIES: YchJ family metal-binding protein [unclassified Shewanella]MEC4725250.1 SEC-C domain-containing protein [Shewanella sp. D64]MEC4735904.1 SEC-C domain-containing protein [Shewanella sp. E94]WBJ93128.1 SEC-C domain-containing protein [Shewanella sp. MTB7]